MLIQAISASLERGAEGNEENGVELGKSDGENEAVYDLLSYQIYKMEMNLDDSTGTP